MTLAIFNRFVDNATGVSKTESWSEQHGSLVVGDQVLYWKEDIKRKPFKAKGKHRQIKARRVFFRGLSPIPRKHSLFHKLSKLFGGWS